MEKKLVSRTVLATFFLCSCLSTCNLKAEEKSIYALKDTLKILADKYLAENNIHGLSYCIVLQNDSIIFNCAGEINDSNFIDTSHRWMFASCTKNFISAAILDLQEEGRLAIDDPIHKYFSHPKIDSQYSIKQLLNHTTNFSDYNGSSKYFRAVLSNPEEKWTAIEVLDSLVPIGSSSGKQKFRYSNTNYLVLGLVIEKITGNPLNDELKARYFTPLGMSKTSLAPHEYSYSQLPGAWYDTDRDGILNDLSLLAKEPVNATLSISYASGNIVSTPRDMAVWVKALYSGSIISDASLAIMKKATSGTASKKVFRGYGLGMEHIYFSDCHHYGHSGHQIHTSAMFYTPELDVSIAIALNEPAQKKMKQFHMELFKYVREYYSGADE